MEVARCHLDGNADAVEFCPHEQHTNILAASTYTLHEGDLPRRSGSISLFDVGKGCLKLLHQAPSAAIFDIKWNPARDCVCPLLAEADANGCLVLYRLDCDLGLETGCFLKEMQSVRVTPKSSSMCLCLDWNPSADYIAVGLSDGSASVISLSESKLASIHAWKPHDFEMWAACFDVGRPQLVYTGSDDCKFSCWDLRGGGGSGRSPVFRNTQSHKMGVCCITKSPGDTNAVFTGSYDEHIRAWDVRLISKPVSEARVYLGGGVWRIKHHPCVQGLALAACMHNGFAVVNLGVGECAVLERHAEHNSLAYGADWQKGQLWSAPTLVATCSFYDRLLRTWVPAVDLINYGRRVGSSLVGRTERTKPSLGKVI